MTDSRTTELLREGLTERGIEWKSGLDGVTIVGDWCFVEYDNGKLAATCEPVLTPEQAIAATLGAPISADLRKALDFMRIWISDDAHLGESEFSYELEKAEGLRKLDAIESAVAATLGRPKAKAYPYGYEPDTGAFDCTRCECGCINDISATYCNDCGGEIEIDMYAEKEIYHTPRHLVFAEKHDDGSIEFGGKRYVAATLGSEREKALEELVRDAYWLIVRAIWSHESQDKFASDWNERVSVLGIEVDG